MRSATEKARHHITFSTHVSFCKRALQDARRRAWIARAEKRLFYRLFREAARIGAASQDVRFRAPTSPPTRLRQRGSSYICFLPCVRLSRPHRGKIKRAFLKQRYQKAVGFAQLSTRITWRPGRRPSPLDVGVRHDHLEQPEALRRPTKSLTLPARGM